MMDDRNAKRDGFGIGEIGNAPETTPMDEIEADEIRRANRQKEIIDFRCTKCRSTNYSIEAMQAHIMGCCVLCVDCLEKYHGHSIRAEIEFRAERKKIAKYCQICGQPGDWNGGAGQDLCDRHWDSY